MKRLIIYFLLLAFVAYPVYSQIDKQATKETKALYKNLKKSTEKGIMFGHQDDTAYGIGWKYDSNRSDVKSVCGDYPAVYGWELGNLELDRKCNLDSVEFTKIRQLICEAYKRGGVNTISWHLNNPEGGSAWQKETTTSVKSILPNGVNNKKYLLWMDILANYLLSLKDEDGKLIPILFRPYHEHTGGWFWWGKNQCTTDEYTSLWKYTVDYLRDTKNVHSLLYTYSPNFTSLKEELFERYPGDEYVDILGVDCYQSDKENTDKFIQQLDHSLKVITEEAQIRGKIAILSETGFSKIPMNEWWTSVLWKTIEKYPIAYVLLWRNAVEKPDHYFVPYPGQISSQDFVKFKNEKRSLFQQDIKNMYR